jgi:hypothetical protein
MKLHHFVAIWLMVIVLIAALSGCATNPSTGRTQWDPGATVRVLSAALGALNPQPVPAPAPEALDLTDHP